METFPDSLHLIKMLAKLQINRGGGVEFYSLGNMNILGVHKPLLSFPFTHSPIMEGEKPVETSNCPREGKTTITK